MAPRCRRWLLLTLIAGIPVAVAAGCAQQGIPGFGTVTGAVTDAESGQPVAGALVEASGVSATTGADGRYLLRYVPAGRTALTASCFGYERRSAADFTVVGETVVEFAVQLTPKALRTVTVTGKVEDTEGAPVPGATVAVGAARATTDATGAYRIEVPGSHTLVASIEAQGYEPKHEPIALPRGQTWISHNVTLHAVAGGAIEGTVIDAHDGAPIAGVRVAAANGVCATSTGDDGSYRLEGLPSLSADLTFTARGYREEQRSVAVEPGSVLRLDVPLVAPATGQIRARAVSAPSGTPLEAVLVTTDPLGRNGLTDSAGTVRLAHVPEGSYQIRFKARDYGEGIVGPVHVDALNWPEAECRLEPTLAGVVGSVADEEGRPLVGCPITVLGLPSLLSLDAPPVTDVDGRFAIHDIQVGAAPCVAELVAGDGRARAHVTLVPGTTSDAGSLVRIR